MSEKGDKEEKGTRTGGTGSQGNDTGATSSGKDRPANWDYANPDDDSSIGNTQPPPGSIRRGPQGGGEGAENTANGVAVGGASGLSDDPPTQGLPGGDPRGNFGSQSGGGSGGVGSGETRGKK